MLLLILSYAYAKTSDQSHPPTGGTRSMYSVLLNCWTTIFICAWQSLHLNIPPEGDLEKIWRKIKLMLWMLVVPELVLAWAVKQRFAAKQLAKEYGGERDHSTMRWSLTFSRQRMDNSPRPLLDHGRLQTRSSFPTRRFQNAEDAKGT